MSYGLKGKVKQMVMELDAARSNKKRPRNLSLRQHVERTYKDNDGKPLTINHLFADLGIEPSYTTLEDLYSDHDTAYLAPEIIRNGIYEGMGGARREMLAAIRKAMVSQSPIGSESGGQHFITPEFFLDPVMRGAVQGAFYQDLVIREIPVPQPAVIVPRINLSDASIADSGEAVTIEEGSVSYDTKTIVLGKQAKGIKHTYESIMFNTLDLVSVYFNDLGRLLASKLNGECVNTITAGDQADASEAAAIVGVLDTNEGFTYEDIVQIWVRLSLLGRNSTSIVGNETTARQYLNLPEVKNKQFPGAALLPTNLKTPLPTMQDLYVSVKIAANQLAFQDSSLSLVQLTAQPLMVETEKIVSKQIAGTYATIFTGFSKLQRNASIVLDSSIDFAGHGFPAWMNPFSE